MHYSENKKNRNFCCFRKLTVFLLSSMSRENLLTMRPRGVRSKKETGALMTVENKQS